MLYINAIYMHTIYKCYININAIYKSYIEMLCIGVRPGEGHKGQLLCDI